MLWELPAMAGVGYAALSTRTSCAGVHDIDRIRKASNIEDVAISRKAVSLIEAKLQAESSTCMYSEQGLEALIGAVSGHVCQLLIVASNWIPGLRRHERLGHFFEKVPSPVRVGFFVAQHQSGMPFLIIFVRFHKFIGNAYGMIGVLNATVLYTSPSNDPS